MLQAPQVELVLTLKTKTDTEGYIRLRVKIPKENKNPYVSRSTGIKVPVRMFDAEEQIIRKVHPRAGQLNKKLSDEVGRVQDLLDQDNKANKTFTRQLIESRVNPAVGLGDFLRFFDDHLRYLAISNSDGYLQHMRSEYNTFVRFAGDRVTFSQINTEFLRKYEQYLTQPVTTTHKKKPVALTTLHTKLKRLKEVVDLAVNMGHIDKRALQGYKLLKYIAPERVYLTLQETELISDRIYSGKLDHDAALHKVACYFLIECYSGIRFSDWSRFTIETLVSDRNLKVRARKNKEPIYLPLNVFKRLGAIVDYTITHNVKFDLPERETNAMLRALSSLLGIGKHITTHVGRHTCGTLLGEMGYNTSEIAQVLGISEQTAKVYIKNTRQALNNAFDRHGGL